MPVALSSPADRHAQITPRDFLDLPLTPITTVSFIKEVVERARDGTRTRISYLNAMGVNMAADDADYRRCLQSTDILYADGQAIVWASRWLGQAVPERVNAGDFLPDLFRACRREGVRVFLLGSKRETVEQAASAFRATCGVEIVGTRDGFFNAHESPWVVAEINAARPDLLIIGMGVPRQERWLWAHWEQLEVPVAWCVGATFDYYAAEFPRAPVWMRRAGLEWLFRLALEPRRLWRRYLIGNPRFVWRVLRRRGVGR